jgi:MoaA/NifB/PqqE/SkfB family radical SAM enzyme
MYCPKHIFIETVGSACTTRCTMCSISKWDRKPMIMGDEAYEKILQNFLPYVDEIEKISFFNFGEPLLDQKIGPRIARAKELGFRGTGISTNATALNEKRSIALLDAGLETLICSLDGNTAETHESIRVRANFKKIVSNIIRFIELREERGGATRLVVRFTAMKENIHEWPDFKKDWLSRLDDKYNDIVFFMRVHDWGDGNEDYESQDAAHDKATYTCPDFLSKQYVFADGSVAFCCADYNGFFKLPSAITEDPIKIYNNEIFSKYRSYMKDGRINELKHCDDCSIPMSRCNIVEYSPNGNINKYELSEHIAEEYVESLYA